MSYRVPQPNQTDLYYLTVVCMGSWCPVSMVTMFCTRSLVLCFLYEIQCRLLRHLLLNAWVCISKQTHITCFTSVKQHQLQGTWTDLRHSNSDVMAAPNTVQHTIAAIAVVILMQICGVTIFGEGGSHFITPKLTHSIQMKSSMIEHVEQLWWSKLQWVPIFTPSNLQ